MTSTLTRYPSYLATGPSRRHSRPLPSFIAQLLANPPENGVHGWIFKCACLLKPWCLDDEAVRIIARASGRCRRRVPVSEIEDAVRMAVNDWKPGSGKGQKYRSNVSVTPTALRPSHEYVPSILARFSGRCQSDPDPDFLREISWVPLPPERDQGATTKTFLDTVFMPGDRVLLFTNYRSQGDYEYVVGQGCWELGARPGDASTPSELPTSGPCGVWFMSNPISGQWATNDSGRLSRRSRQTVTRWTHLVIESDNAPEGQWLKAVVLLPLPIVAIYTSGGRSIHALIRIDAADKADADAAATVLKDRLSPLGADPAALTSVRLTRLPGTLRCGQTDEAGTYTAHDSPLMQRLLWLAGAPADKSILQDLHLF